MDLVLTHFSSRVEWSRAVSSLRHYLGSSSPFCYHTPSSHHLMVYNSTHAQKLFSIARFRAKTKVTEIFIREMLYADDAALASHTEDGLQRLIDCFSQACKDFGLTISIKKTNVCAQDISHAPCIKIDDHTLEVVDEFVYLGSTISTNMNLDTEINKRIEKTAATLSKLTKRVWNNTYSRRTPRCVCTRHASSACFSTAARLGPPTCARNTDSSPFTCAVWGTSWASNGKIVRPTVTSSHVLESLPSTLSWASGASDGLAMCGEWRTAAFPRTFFMARWHQETGEWDVLPFAIKTSASAKWKHAI